MCTWPETLRAARPIVWMSDRPDRRKPSLSASRMATSDTSGRSRPSRSRLMPTSTSYSPMPQLAQQLHAPQRVHLGVQVADADALLQEVVRQVLGHLLGERGDEHALVLLDAVVDLAQQVVDLAGGRLHDDLGVHQAGRPDDLLDHPVGDRQLVVAGGGRQVDRLADPLDELLPPQRAVVGRARQPEAVVHQRALARHVALEHRADLRHGHVRLVDDQQEVLGEVVDQRVGRGARRCGRRCAASSSRCPSTSRSGASSRCRTWCACAAAGPRAACSAAPAPPAGPPAPARCR